MSRFGLGLMGDFEEDPFFGSHVRQMNHMMNSMFADPFGLMGPPALTNEIQQPRMNPMPGMQMMPFGFPMMPSLPMGRMFAGLGNMSQDPNCHSFTSSSIMTMTSSGPDGRPQVYQETMSTRSAPGGVKETKKTVSDSRTGQRSMAIGHHIGERAHILEREQNMHSGEQEERQEFINLEEDEAEAFNQEWQSRTKRSVGAIAGSSHRARNPYNRSQQENKLLALPSTVPSSQSTSQSRPLATPRRGIKPASSSRTSKTKSSSRSAENSCSTSTSTESNKTISSPSSTLLSNCQPENTGATTTWCTSTSSSPTTARNNTSRKREHSPDDDDDDDDDDDETSSSPSNKRLSSQSQSSNNKDPIPCIDVTD